MDLKGVGGESRGPVPGQGRRLNRRHIPRYPGARTLDKGATANYIWRDAFFK